ncbi:MAG: cytochrome C, partial [Rhodospirillaceae bacterium]|nr:cytochrome C [Rhodospirillaceae bacterium]
MFFFNVFRISVAVSCFWIFCGNTGLGYSETLKTAQRLSNGQVLLHAGGCVNCHTDYENNGSLLAGGKKIKTPFGIFYSPNITSDKRHGIGNWSEKDFILAMRKGISPNGSHYFPAFPYPSFTFLTEKDIKAIKDYIFSLPGTPKPNEPHELTFPFNIRAGQVLWKSLYFTEGPFQINPNKSTQWNRGAYLSRAVTHCGECHTRR